MTLDPRSSSTQWSLIVQAQGEGPRARAAMGQLIQRYERSIVAMIRHFRHPPNQTPEDLKQAFLTRILSNGDIAVLDRSKGPFRAWLKRAVRNYLFNAWDTWNAQKNPDRRTDYPEAFDAMGGDSPEDTLNRKFAADTLSYALEQLRLTAPKRFDALKPFLVSLDSSTAAAPLGMTRTALRTAIHRLRQSFQDLLTKAIADTLDVDLADPAGKAEVEREKRLMYRSLYEPSNYEARLSTG